MENLDFTAEELAEIDRFANEEDINLWAQVLRDGDVSVIRNPVLPGFNPDPSFCRVGEDYYLATSTFEWYPGVQIHHIARPRELAAGGAAAEPRGLLDMRGEPGFLRGLGALPEP